MMPHTKFLFTVGCVAQATTNRNRTSLTLYFDKAEIMALNAHFTSALVDAILASGASAVVPPKMKDAQLRMGSKGLAVRSIHELRQYNPKTDREMTVPHLTPIDDGTCYYWLRSVKRKAKKPAAKKRR